MLAEWVLIMASVAIPMQSYEACYKAATSNISIWGNVGRCINIKTGEVK